VTNFLISDGIKVEHQDDGMIKKFK
jgi:hypothetical protein